jgi:hypothetical protein
MVTRRKTDLFRILTLVMRTKGFFISLDSLNSKVADRLWAPPAMTAGEILVSGGIYSRFVAKGRGPGGLVSHTVSNAYPQGQH